MRPRLIDKGHAKRAKGGNQAAGIPAKDSTQDCDWQQNSGRTPDTTIKMVAKQKALQGAIVKIHTEVIMFRLNNPGAEGSEAGGHQRLPFKPAFS
jgi:hypothetical protein